ncbi:MAG: hypothetical protein KGI54_15955 [Pseudomonadota bacterium]|nr:hypothetical protein [Pseudomonadota bacterium]
MVILYPLLVIASLLATAAACLFVNWWAPIFCDANGNLPKWLKWFQTFDATCDEAWKGGYIAASWGSTPFRRYLARVYWLYRNPAYGWDYWPFGMQFIPNEWTVKKYTSIKSSVTFFAIGPKLAFNFYMQRGGLYVKIGWKAWGYFDPIEKKWLNTSWGPSMRVPLCFTVMYKR